MSCAIAHRTARQIAAICLTSLTLIAGMAGATTWTVHPDGSGDFPTIAAAVAAAADGDIIGLGDGTFTGAGNWDIALVNRNLAIRSISGESALCIIDCYEGPEAHRGFIVDGGTPRIYGVRVLNGRAVTGGAVLVSAGAPIFVGCDFRGCEASETGGGVHVESGAAPEFTECWFWANDAGTLGGGAFLATGSDATIDLCVVGYNNAADAGGLAVLSSSGLVSNTNIHNNDAVGHGGGVYVGIGVGFTFEDCRMFENNAHYGGAVAVLGATSPIFDDCLLFDNLSSLQGGGIFCSATATPEIRQCSLLYNDSPYGAGLYSDTLALPRILNTLVIYNHGTAFGSDGYGTAIFECCNLFGNWVGDWTGSIAGQLGMDGNINLDPLIMLPGVWGDSGLTPGSPCAAVNNPDCGDIGSFPLVPGGRPGYEVLADGLGMLPTIQAAIDLAPDQAAIRALGTFTGDGNRDLEFGGKDLYFTGGDEVGETVIDCEGSPADPHRAFFFDQTGETPNASINNVTIRNGYDQYSGGGIRIVSAAPTLDNVIFENCTVGSNGGALVIASSGVQPPVTVRECVFTGNEAGMRGGGLFCQMTPVEVIDCEFTDNVSPWGGGAVIELTYDSLVSGCRFTGNHGPVGAANWGGGLLVNTDHVTISNCQFEGNTAAFGGGAVLRYALTTMTDCAFEDCTADSLGGAIYAYGDDVPMSFTDVTFVNNEADRGGALCLEDGIYLSALHLYFETNTATTSGGAIHQFPVHHYFGGSLDLDDCIFDSNQVTGTGGQGGGLWLAGNANLVDSRLVWSTIDVAGRGGALYLAPEAVVSLESCTLSRNAAHFGGCAYASQATLELTSCQVLENQAGYAGAIYYDGDAGSSVSWSTIADNASTSTGGAIICDHGSSPTVTNTTLVGNSTGTYGAHLVCWDGSYPVVSNSILAFAPAGQAVGVGTDGGMAYFECSDIWGNAGGDWVGDIAYQLQDDGNLHADPLFCDLAGHDLTLFNISPCLPENSMCGALAGAWGQGCIDPNTGVPDGLPAAVGLEQNAPNPFNPATVIAFALPAAGPVELSVFDAQGRCVRRLVRGVHHAAGRHQVRWDGSNDDGLPVGSGVYLFRLRAGSETICRKGILIK